MVWDGPLFPLSQMSSRRCLEGRGSAADAGVKAVLVDVEALVA